MATFNVTYQITYNPTDKSKVGIVQAKSNVQIFASSAKEAGAKAQAQVLGMAPWSSGYVAQFNQISVQEFNACNNITGNQINTAGQ